MKQQFRDINNKGEGSIKLIPEEDEDLWHAFNLIREGDEVRSSTYRKVIRPTATGGTQSTKVKLDLTIKVTSVDYDAEGGILRCSGTNVSTNEHVRLGQHHTLELAVSRAFTLTKAQFDSLDKQRIYEATHPETSADLAIMLIQDGFAQLFLIGNVATIFKGKHTQSLPRKQGPAAAGYATAWQKFMKGCLNIITNNVEMSVVKCLVLAGPGYAKDSLKSYIAVEAGKQEGSGGLKALLSRIVLAHASSTGLNAVQEVLGDERVGGQIADTKALKERRALDQFMSMLNSDPERAYYGPTHVIAAAKEKGVKTLLITDALFRTKDVAARQKYCRLLNQVTKSGGEYFILSSRHVSGVQLTQMSGIAAILRFPLPHLEDIEVPVEEVGGN